MSALQILWLIIMWVALGAGVWLTRDAYDHLGEHWTRWLLLTFVIPVACGITLGVVLYP